jgi:hypothetical protein
MKCFRKFYQKYAGWYNRYKFNKWFHGQIADSLGISKKSFKVSWRKLWE